LAYLLCIRSAPFTTAIGIYKPTDVRPILSAYADKDVAAEFAKIESTRKAQEYATWAATPAGKRALAKADKTSSASSSGGWGLPSRSSLLGAPAQPSLATLPKPTAPGPPPSYVDMKRAEAQAMYLEEQKYWKANEGEIKRLMEEDRERQIKEMGGGTVRLLSLVVAVLNVIGLVIDAFALL
jgi:import inner membrane translocase subunit TIM50